MIEMSFPKTLDNTIVTTWSGCNRAMFLAHLMNLHPKTESVHLVGGGAYAKGLETYRKAFYHPTNPVPAEEAMALGLKALFKSYGFDEAYDAALGEDHVKSAFRIAELYARHFTEFTPHTDLVKPLILNGEPAVEQSFTLEMDIKHPDTGDPILFHGRYDMLAEYYGDPWVFDDKTCSQLGATWISQWDFRSQFTGYCFGARAAGIPVKGAIVRGGCLYKADVKFMQAPTARESWQLDQWWEDLHRIVYQMVQYYIMAKDRIASGVYDVERPNAIIQTRDNFSATGFFTEKCNAYGGCKFKPLCSSKFPERWLNNYRIRVWDPTNPDGEDD